VIFTHTDIMNQLSGFASPRSKLTRLLKEEALIKIRRGLFVDDPGTSQRVLAPVIYGPSYISFHYALAAAGLIPEQVKIVTSASYGKNKNKVFRTPLGEFHYWYIPPAVYPHGITLQEDSGTSYLIATPEKALCDSIYKMRTVTSIKDITELLIEDWRIEKSDLLQLDYTFIQWLAPIYKTKSLNALSRWYTQEVSNA